MMRTMGLALAMGCLGATAALPMRSIAAAPAWPAKPVHILTPYQAGGSADAMARPIAAKLSEMWGQPVIVENKPGANGILATQTMIKAPADGYTLLYHITGIIQNPLLYKTAGYDPLKDIAPVLQIGSQSMALSVPAKSPLANLDQLVAQGRGNPAGQSYGSVGNGHTGHIWSELLTSEHGIKGTHAAYKGSGPLVVDLIAGRLDWAFLSTAEAATRLQDKSLRVLALSGPHRVKQLPGVATLQELGYPGFEMVGWHGLFAPAGTPAATLRKIEDDVRKVLADPEVARVAETQFIEITGLGRADFTRVVQTDHDRWRTLIRKFDIKNE